MKARPPNRRLLQAGRIGRLRKPQPALSRYEKIGAAGLHISGVLCAYLLGGNERAFHIDAHEGGLALLRHERSSLRQHRTQAFLGIRHRCRADRRHAARRLVHSYGVKCLLGRIAHVCPSAPMKMQVDEPWHDIAARCVYDFTLHAGLPRVGNRNARFSTRK